MIIPTEVINVPQLEPVFKLHCIAKGCNNCPFKGLQLCPASVPVPQRMDTPNKGIFMDTPNKGIFK